MAQTIQGEIMEDDSNRNVPRELDPNELVSRVLTAGHDVAKKIGYGETALLTGSLVAFVGGAVIVGNKLMKNKNSSGVKPGE